MLLQFRAKNFRSIANEIILDMTAINNLRDNVDFVFESNGIKIVPVAALFGPNAGGKSNILNSLQAFRYNILNSATMNQEDPFFATPFLIGNEKIFEPTEFEVFFLSGDREYRYGYSILNGVIEEEWMYFRKASKNNTKWIQVFERTKNVIQYKNVQKYNVLKEFNHLFTGKLLVLSFFNNKDLGEIKEFSTVYNWINNAMFVEPTIDENNLYWKIYFHDKKRKDKCIQFLKNFDPTIDNLVIEEDTEIDNKKTYRAYVVHKGEKLSISFESNGTKKLINLFLIISLFFERKGILVIDELDCQLHPLIFRKIIRMFHDKEINKYGTQLVFTSHNLIVLDGKDLRRDEIWFVEKDEEGCTDLYSLASFKVDDKRFRSDLDFGKNYLSGRFGAIPYIVE